MTRSHPAVHYRIFQQPVSYEETWQRMRLFTQQRQESTPDEVWLLEHTPVFSLGQAGKPEHLLQVDSNIPLVHTDRGGQVTYHGPGQLVVYFLVSLKRLGIYVKEFVSTLEDIILLNLQRLGVDQAVKIPSAPGIYVPWPSSKATGILAGYAKIAALGLKVHNGCTYHGLSLNVRMDLTPFSWINPCGYSHLPTVDLSMLGVPESHLLITQYHQPMIQSIQELLFTDHTVTPIIELEP